MFVRRYLGPCVALAVALLAAGDVSAQSRKPAGKRPARFQDTLKEGDVAPDFELKTLDGKKTVKLSSFRGDRPVALVFGSYT